MFHTTTIEQLKTDIDPQIQLKHQFLTQKVC